jgi:hypothetical protein
MSGVWRCAYENWNENEGCNNQQNASASMTVR